MFQHSVPLKSRSCFPEIANCLGPCSAQTHASPRCQLLWTLLCSESRLPKIVKCLRRCPIRPTFPREHQQSRTLLCPDSRLSENVNYLGMCSAQTHASPRLSTASNPRTWASPRWSDASDPTLTGPKSPRDCQVPQTLLCPDSPQNCQVPRTVLCRGFRLPGIVNYLGPCSTQTHASPILTTASGPTLRRLAPS